MKFKRVRQRIESQLTLNNGVLLVALLIGSSWVWSTVDAIQRNFTLQQQVDAATQQIAVQQLENKTQQLENKYYQSNEYQELSARARLNKAQPGEHLLILPANTVQPIAQQQAQTQDVPITSRSDFAQWMYFLFGKKSS